VSNYMRKAVELANWQTTRLGNQRIAVFAPHGEGGDYPLTNIGYLDAQHVKDALAAQLVRQVDATGKYFIVEWPTITQLCDRVTADTLYEYESENDDRTMNTIKAIVDSEVL